MNYIAALYQFTEILEPYPIRQSIAEKLEELSITGTILIGHEGHPEVEGTMGRISGDVYLVSNTEDVYKLKVKDPKKLSYTYSSLDELSPD